MGAKNIQALRTDAFSGADADVEALQGVDGEAEVEVPPGPMIFGWARRECRTPLVSSNLCSA